MITNEMIKRIHENAVAHGFHEPDSEPTFGEYCALIHEEISEAFSAWRNGEPNEYVDDDGKPQGVWVELADVVIRCADAMGAWKYKFEVREINIKPQGLNFGSFITELHYAVSEMWDAEDKEFTENILKVLVSYVYKFAELCGIDLDAIIERKHAYNVTRPYKHGKRM